LAVEHDFKHGFSATLTKAPSGTYYLAFRGTETFFGRDGGANVVQGLEFTTSQYNQAIDLTQAVIRALPKGARLILTGHSLGGGLATAAAYATGSDAITFNASSVNATYQRGTPGNIRSHVVMTAGVIPSDPLALGRACVKVSHPLLFAAFNHRRLPGTVIPHPPRDLDTHGMINFPHYR
jgi:pimeloyl-ACP methyl ester carboxylesterase